MTTVASSSQFAFHGADDHDQRMLSHRLTRYAVPVGRGLFALIFILAAPGHFSAATIAYAHAQGVALANILVPLSGVLALLGGTSVALGFKTRVGAALLVLFLLPVTLLMHKFWSVADPQAAMMQQVMFMKNVSLLGCALILTHVGAGPISIDARLFKARNDLSMRGEKS